MSTQQQTQEGCWTQHGTALRYTITPGTIWDSAPTRDGYVCVFVARKVGEYTTWTYRPLSAS